MCHLKPWKSMTPMALMFRQFKKRLIHDVLDRFIKALAIDSRESSLLSLNILKRASSIRLFLGHVETRFKG